LVIQVNSYVDISNPSHPNEENEEEEESFKSNRTLKLECTDGEQTFYALEYKKILELSKIKIGSKMVLNNITVLRGLVMMIPESIKILGGEINN
jgi:hypothetical protein